MLAQPVPPDPVAGPDTRSGKGVAFLFKENELPENITPSQAEQIFRAGLREYHREYRRNHPEQVIQQRIRTYRNFLVKHGFVVIAPNYLEGGEN